MCNSFLLSLAQARSHTHTQARTHTNSDNRLTYAGIKTNLLIDIDWGGQVAGCLRAPLLLLPAAAACCVLPLPAASEQKNRQNNNGYTHIHTCTHAQQLMPDDWHFTKDTRPRVAKRAKRNKCDAFYLLQLCNRPALPHYPFLLPPCNQLLGQLPLPLVSMSVAAVAASRHRRFPFPLLLLAA